MVGDFSASKIVGGNIQRIRTLQGIKQLDICAICDISQNRLSRLENGAAHVSIDILASIATALRVPIVELLAGVPTIELGQSDIEVISRYHSDAKFKALVDTLMI